MGKGYVVSLSGLLALLVVGCPGPGPGPEPPTPPASPTWLGSNLEPMIVDWDPDQRQALEITMKQGVAVVEYDARGFRLLRDCKVDGKYGFMGSTRRERVYHLDTADDIRANLPLGGFGLAAKLGGELTRGATLDVATVMIGQLRTTWRTVTPKDLVGKCEGASHIVRGATLGAFAMDKGKKQEAKAAAEIFKLGASYDRSSSANVRNVDGSFDDCATAKPDGSAPPGQCGALVRLELEPLAAEAASAAAAKADAPAIATKDPCPPSFVYSDGKCTRAAANVTAECSFGDAQGCEAACRAGRQLSCARIGLMKVKGVGGARAPREGAELLLRACEADVGEACVVLADLIAEGAPGVPKNPTEALRGYGKACELGSADGCQRFGARMLTGMGAQKNPELAARAMDRGCNGGNKDACSDLGLLFLGGSPPFREDLPRAAQLFKLACDGMSGVGCANFGYMLEFGQGVTKNIQASAAAYAKGCRVEDTQCLWFGALVFTGKAQGLPKDEKKAVDLWKLACKAGSVPACAILRAYVDPKIPLDIEVAQAYVNLWQGTCGNKLARDCSALGVLLLAAGRTADGERVLERGCGLGDDWGCAMAKLRHN